MCQSECHGQKCSLGILVSMTHRCHVRMGMNETGKDSGPLNTHRISAKSVGRVVFDVLV